MPLTGTGDVLGQAILAAQDAARDSFMTSHSQPLSASDLAGLRVEMAKALGRAIITHMTTTGGISAVTVTGVTVGQGVASGSLI
jgi:hypothetical protein